MRATNQSSKRLKTTHKKITEKSSIAHVLNAVLESAAQSGASDVHIEPRATFLQVRYRVDGMLHQAEPLPKKVQDPLASYIKILAGLQVDESHAAQQGQFKIEAESGVYMLEVSLLPITEGEKIVIRMLRDNVLPQSLGELGLWGSALGAIQDSALQTKGLILAVGPAGSGKSTTLRAILDLLNNQTTNIATIEDPIEHTIKNANQTQLNQRAGITVDSALKALLKQDPNVILVNELHSHAAADAAVQAALSGRLLLSSFHGSRAVMPLQRLVSMGIEPYLVASTVRTIINQRVVRRLCPQCRVLDTLTTSESTVLKKHFHCNSPTAFQKLQHALTQFQKSSNNTSQEGKVHLTATQIKQVYKSGGEGCGNCSGTGYKGRIGLFEVLENTPELQQCLINSGTTQDLEEVAAKQHLLPLAHDALIKVLSGLTSIEEVAKAIS